MYCSMDPATGPKLGALHGCATNKTRKTIWSVAHTRGCINQKRTIVWEARCDTLWDVFFEPGSRHREVKIPLNMLTSKLFFKHRTSVKVNNKRLEASNGQSTALATVVVARKGRPEKFGIIRTWHMTAVRNLGWSASRRVATLAATGQSPVLDFC